ncbi:natural cytotoxicity triggering receptor 3 ligand 1-like [Fukomys damarensis]|uniref:natural cytotoxicity triggering receptor 3 ligand 1-like n=1 Tax=Fukomys damarensis TaxID=885580 RepID=UPI00145520B3|nr:natural cytotoxicity triggering receptor 3 ligand 1-like [Fukomys damarensis]
MELAAGVEDGVQEGWGWGVHASKPAVSRACPHRYVSRAAPSGGPRLRLFSGSLSVEMPGRSQIAYVNGNVTLSCQIPGCPSLDTRIMGVTWYRKDLVSEAEIKVFELYGDQQKAFRRGAMVSAQKLKRGDASLQLPGVGLGDAGEYRCELTVTPQKAKGWVLLEVLAKLAITLKKPIVKSNGTHLVCQSSGFSPESISITWVKWTQKAPQSQRISKDNVTGPTVKNEDGVFSITSYLKLNACLEDNGTIYQCVVEYPSLSISQKVNFTLPVIEAERIHLSLVDKRFIWYFALIF